MGSLAVWLFSIVTVVHFATPSAFQTPSTKPSPSELGTYLRRPDASYSFSPVSVERGVRRFKLVSQTWQGVVWEHEVVVVDESPKTPTKKVDPKQAAILIITGAGSNDKDIADAQIISRISQLPVATLFEIPNQPIFGMKEDDLIAHTFEEYLKSGDASWPLLFPMTKSAIRAMDGLEKFLGYHRFVVTGASKRGWTTWLTAASGDKRVIGIAPQVYNNLNLMEQIPHQKALWGYFSEEIADYTKRGLQDVLQTPRGQLLALMVDPYAYLGSIHMPIFMLNGANDPYWAPDALSLFSARLPHSWRVLFLPNEGHVFHDKSVAWQSLGVFAQACAQGRTLPSGNAKIVGSEVQTSTAKNLVSQQLYVAESENWDFHQSHWELVPGLHLPPATHKQAAVVVFKYRVGGEIFSESSPILLVNKP